MRLTDKQANNLSGAAWVDYFRGYPNLCDCRAENNNWRKMHHLPMIRRRGKGNETCRIHRKYLPRTFERISKSVL